MPRSQLSQVHRRKFLRNMATSIDFMRGRGLLLAFPQYRPNLLHWILNMTTVVCKPD